MEKGFKNWSEFYQKINLVFNAIIAFSLLPFGWVYLELERGVKRPPLLEGTGLMVLSGAFFVLIVLLLWRADKTYKRDLPAISRALPLGEKLMAYYQLQVRKFIWFEGAAVLALIITFVSKNFLFVLVYIFILFLFSLGRPKYDRVVEQLRLTKDEQKLLETDVEL